MKTLFSIITIAIAMVAVSCNFSGNKEKKNEEECCSNKPDSCCSKDSTVKAEAISFNAELSTYIDSVKSSFAKIDSTRKLELEAFAAKIKAASDTLDSTELVFICTHNSRRSHMSQLWASVAANYYGCKDVNCYSGGTEATAFNPRAVLALREAGFAISATDSTENPIYMVEFAEGVAPIKAFSKKYDDASNPTDNFFAVMTCSHADEACPLVAGAADRVAITYEDPKAFDGTPEEAAMYAERCYQIAGEMFYVFSQVNNG